MNVVGLFAGIGGFEAGFANAGHVTTLLCDSSPEAQAVLRLRFPDADLVGDVGELASLPSGTDVLCAGFPCQNLSMAGDKTGIEGVKSGVVEHVFRLAAKAKTPWIVIENVRFMLHLDGGRAMAHLVESLEAAGYCWAYRVVDTQFFGLPQRRRRVFIVASRVGDPASVLFADEEPSDVRSAPDMTTPIGFYWTEGRSGVGLMRDCVPTLKAGSGIGIASPPAALLPNGRVVVPTIEEAERLQGFNPGWTEVDSPGHARKRWRLIGNSVSVPVVEWVARRLSNPAKRVCERGDSLSTASRWPSAAEGDGRGRRWQVNASESPIRHPQSLLSGFMEGEWPDLSQRALLGFISRATSSSLKFPPDFLRSLERALG